MIPRFLWPVYGYDVRGMREQVACFFEWADAATFAMHPTDFECEQRHLFIDEPRYDRREGGYVPA
jgi:hypothetical protein